MPIYEYRCPSGHLTELFQRMSDAPLAVCPVCGDPVEKVLHPVAIHFKGSGFYNTDYGRGKGAKADGKGEGADASTTSANGDGGAKKGADATTGSSSSGSGSGGSTGSGGSSSGGSSSD